MHQQGPEAARLRRHTQRGFSLIEVLIVVTIILIIAAIAIPNFMRSRIAANEAATVAAIRTIVTAETAYATTYPNSGYGYSNDLASLGGSPCTTPSSSAACLIDNVLATATSTSSPRSGYVFTYTPDTTLGFKLYADPANYGYTGTKHFYTDPTLVIHYQINNVQANANDPAVQ